MHSPLEGLDHIDNPHEVLGHPPSLPSGQRQLHHLKVTIPETGGEIYKATLVSLLNEDPQSIIPWQVQNFGYFKTLAGVARVLESQPRRRHATTTTSVPHTEGELSHSLMHNEGIVRLQVQPEQQSDGGLWR